MNAAAVAPPRANVSGGKELMSQGGGKHSFGSHAQSLENGLGSHMDRDLIWGSAE